MRDTIKLLESTPTSYTAELQEPGNGSRATCAMERGVHNPGSVRMDLWNPAKHCYACATRNKSNRSPRTKSAPPPIGTGPRTGPNERRLQSFRTIPTSSAYSMYRTDGQNLYWLVPNRSIHGSLQGSLGTRFPPPVSFVSPSGRRFAGDTIDSSHLDLANRNRR